MAEKKGWRKVRVLENFAYWKKGEVVEIPLHMDLEWLKRMNIVEEVSEPSKEETVSEGWSDVRPPVWRGGIEITTRSENRFSDLEPQLASRLGVGFKGYGSEWIVYFPPTKEIEDKIASRLEELRIPFKRRTSWGPPYLT